MRKGFTLVELLVIVAILGILVCLLMGVLGAFGVGFGKTFHAEVTEKWTEFDYDNNKLYRIRTISPTGENDIWDSYWCHNNIAIGVSYEFRSSNGKISIVSTDSMPARIVKQNE